MTTLAIAIRPLSSIAFKTVVNDSTATGPMAWNDWTAALLRDFFLKVLNVLEKGELATEEAVNLIEQKRADVIAYLSTLKE